MTNPRAERARYWKVKNGALYVRLQYVDDSGKRREKYRRIEKKTEAKSVVEEMLQEVRLLSSGTPSSHRVTFAQLADKYESDRVLPIFKDGFEVARRSSLGPFKSTLKALRQHFGEKLIRLIKPLDIESFKNRQATSSPMSAVGYLPGNGPSSAAGSQSEYRAFGAH